MLRYSLVNIEILNKEDQISSDVSLYAVEKLKRTLVCKADALEMIQGDNTLRHVIQHGIQLKSFGVCNTDMTMNVCIQLIDLVENGKELRFTHIGLDL